MPVPGELLQGRFRIERMLGRGGMGNVYLATHLELGRSVAIKELRPAAGDSFPPGALRQFRMEAQLLHDLRHPNLPQVLDFIEVDGRPYLVMEFIPGRTLDDVLLMDGPVTEAQALDWARQMCDVLAYLHACRPPIIFRDLKPSNVMLTDDGNIKLIDFGIAKFFDADTGGATQTSVRGQVSRGYAAPEQYGGGTDVASDVYSLGATLYTILTREIPPESVDLASGRAALAPIRAARPDLSENIERAVEAMMAVDRKRRPLDAISAKALLGVSGDAPAVVGAVLKAPAAALPTPRGARAEPPVAPREANVEEVQTGRARTAEGVARGHPRGVRSARAAENSPSGAENFVRNAKKSPSDARNLLSDAQTGGAPPAAPTNRRLWYMAAAAVAALLVAAFVRTTPHRSAAIVVRTDPPGATLRVDGNTRGHAPGTLDGLAPGRHMVEASLPGHATAIESVVLQEGERAQVVLQLKVEPRVVLADGTPFPSPLAAPSVRASTPSPPPATPTVRATVAASPTARTTVAPSPTVRATASAPSPTSRATVTAQSPNIRATGAAPSPTVRATAPPIVRQTLPSPPVPALTRAPRASTPVAPDVPLADGLLVPGIRAGPLSLGSSVQAFQLGAPDAQPMSVGRLRLLVSPLKGLGIAPLGDRVALVVIEDFGGGPPSFRTTGGVSVGSPEAAVIAEFGAAPFTRPVRAQTEWRYPSRGIAFRFRRGEVLSIAIFAPR